MAILSSSITLARELAHTDSNGLTDALAIDFANFVSMKMRKMLIDRGIDAAPVQEALKNIVDNQGTYLYPSDMFYVPKYMEINWFENPVTSANFTSVDKFKESNTLPTQGLSWLRLNQPNSNPMVDYRGDYFEIVPTPSYKFWNGKSGDTLTNGIRLFYYVQPVLYATTGDTMTDPEALDYFSFAELIKQTYFYSLEKISKDDLEKDFLQEVGRLIKIIQGDGSQPTLPKGLGLTGWEF